MNDLSGLLKLAKRWSLLSGLAAGLMLASCRAGERALYVSSPPACSAGQSYGGPPLRPPVALSDLPDRSVSEKQDFPEDAQAVLASRWQEGFAASGATTAAITVVQLAADGTDKPARSWSAVSGGTDEPRSFWWASAGKIVTASVILQMEQEGKLAPTDTIERWFPDFPRADLITIEQLLTHTSGVFTFDNDAQIPGRQDYIAPAELIAASARQGLDFCPGTNWLYSNTGYVMLALIAERVDQQPFSQIVERRVSAPFELASIRVLRPDADPNTIVAPKGRPEGAVSAFATIAGAGPVVGETQDMAGLLESWLDGTLIGDQARDGALARLYPMFDSSASYGRGIMVVDIPEQGIANRWVGHLGGSPDAKAVLVYDIARRTYVGLALNTNADGEALALSILEALESASSDQ